MQNPFIKKLDYTQIYDALILLTILIINSSCIQFLHISYTLYVYSCANLFHFFWNFVNRQYHEIIARWMSSTYVYQRFYLLST